ncbi:MAG: nuclear transport factor 2 family protein [Solirubrobacteraceae bacterium]
MPDAAELLARYAWAMDTRNWEALADLLTDDVRFSLEIAGADAPPPVQGNAEVVGFIRAALEAGEGTVRHVITNVRVDGATAGAYLILTAASPEAAEVRSTAVYECDIDDGRLARIHIAFDRPF